MNANRSALALLRQRLPNLARAWLVVWVLALAVQFLQPCCEVLAAGLPHEHGIAADASPAHEEPGAHHGHVGPDDGQDHCASNAGFRLQPALAAASPPPDPAELSLPAHTHPDPEPTGLAPPPGLAALKTPYPTPPPYLFTLRLRL